MIVAESPYPWLTVAIAGVSKRSLSKTAIGRAPQS
jgi:hypothetical protein